VVRPIRWRRDAARLTPGQQADVRAGYTGMMGLADERGYAYFAGLHGLPLPIECFHGSPLFLPWHRAFLYLFERALRDRSPNATVPWWNWATPEGRPGRIPPAFGDERGESGPNPLFSAPVSRRAIEEAERVGVPLPGARTFRQAGAGGRHLPSTRQVDAVLAEADFATFTALVEELHNQVHVWTGGPRGHMGQVPWAAFDPIFWAHHAMVDRLWRLWQLRHNAPGPPQASWDQTLPPFPMTIRQTLDVTGLGYDYASSTASTAARPQP
jgi:tyrosinase